jgi:peptidoglycan/xylan/chitin deacetylase (PgdA/CDA1 family)
MEWLDIPIAYNMEMVAYDDIWKNFKSANGKFFIGFPHIMLQDTKKWIERLNILASLKGSDMDAIDFGLHIHLYYHKKDSNYKKQEKKIKDAIDFCKKHNIPLNRNFIPGWWNYNEDTLKILSKLGFYRLYYQTKNPFMYIYGTIFKKVRYGIEVVPLLTAQHDYDLSKNGHMLMQNFIEKVNLKND